MSGKNGHEDPALVGKVLAVERQHRAELEYLARLRTTPLPMSAQSVDKWSVTLIGEHAVFVFARHGAVMANGDFDTEALAPLGAFDLTPEKATRLRDDLNRVLEAWKAAAPGAVLS